ncbi:MAG: enoyl-CoA hydratase/isomerase family protein [Acidobacteriota bacterium]|nr:enoyl-CoA hydratase/isomerase family protein [Acidobacteriota bacterium]
MSEGSVRTETLDGGIVVLTLDRPRANAFDPVLVTDLFRAVRAASEASALVIASSQTLFSAGWDLPIVRALRREEMQPFVGGFCGLVRELFTFPAPVVAALPGHAIAGGLIVAATADERIAAEGKGELGLSEVALGVPIPRACYEVFRHVLGDRGAEHLAAAGDNVSVARAYEIGLIDRIVPAEEVLSTAVERARQLAGRSRAAYAEIKRVAREDALYRFDRSFDGDPFLDFWFSDETRRRVDALVARLTKKS